MYVYICIHIHMKQTIYYAINQTLDCTSVFWVIFSSHILGLFTAVLKKIISPLPKQTRYQNNIFTHNCNFKMSALATGKLCNLWVAHDHPKLLMSLNYEERLALDTSHFHASLCILVRIAHFTICEIVSTAVHIVSVNLSSVIQF